MRILNILQVEFVGICNGMSDHLPVHHIPGVADGDRRKILKCGIDHVIVLPDAHDGRIGKKTSLYRVLIFVAHM